jgi:hypothetical protein
MHSSLHLEGCKTGMEQRGKAAEALGTRGGTTRERSIITSVLSRPMLQSVKAQGSTCVRPLPLLDVKRAVAVDSSVRSRTG